MVRNMLNASLNIFTKMFPEAILLAYYPIIIKLKCIWTVVYKVVYWICFNINN